MRNMSFPRRCIVLFSMSSRLRDMYHMACIFQGKLQLLSKFEECYKGYTGQWEIPGTQHIDEYQVFWWRNNLDLSLQAFDYATFKGDRVAWKAEPESQEDPLALDLQDAEIRSEDTQDTDSKDGGLETEQPDDTSADVPAAATPVQRQEGTHDALTPHLRTTGGTVKRALVDVTNNQPAKKAAVEEPNVVEEYLNRNLLGKAALKAGKKGNLDDNDRQNFCKEIIWAELGTDPEARISEPRFIFLAKCIKELFPDEITATYYVPRIRKTASCGSVHPKGILYDKYHNGLKYLRKHGMRGSIRARPDEEDIDDPLDVGGASQQEELDIEWLKKYSAQSQDLAKLKWKATSEYRKKLIWNVVSRKSKKKAGCDKVATYISQFPCLGQPWGLNLILDDYSAWLEGQSVNVVSDWVTISNRLQTFLKVKEAGTQAGTFVRLMLAVAKLFKQPLMHHPTKQADNQRPTWKPNSSETMNGLLMHVQTTVDLDTTIARTKELCAKVGRTLQPFPAVVGRSEDHITDSYVVIDEARYHVESPLLAFDTVFKLYQVLDCDYPVQASYAWLFVQQALYKLKTHRDPTIPAVQRSVNDFSRV